MMVVVGSEEGEVEEVPLVGCELVVMAVVEELVVGALLRWRRLRRSSLAC